jgi:diguanylate cyclase (GGDEF)-like protein
MLSTIFQKPSHADRQAEVLSHAEYTLIAEALLRATARLLKRSDINSTVQYFCDCLVDASPSIVLAWVWFGDPDADLIKPQIMAGPARAHAEKLQLERDALLPAGSGARALTQLRTRSIEVSPTSWLGCWRDAAIQHGVRSVLLVPVASGGDHRGMLALYAKREKFFEQLGTGLFETLAELLHAVVMSPRSQSDTPADSSLDIVTGLPLRRPTIRRIENQWSLPAQHDNRGLLVVIDVDDFASLNERHGAATGDAALRQIANLLKQGVRRTDLVARWDGDRFLVWLPGVAGAAARATAEKLLNAIAGQPLVLADGSEIALPVSMGAAPVSSSDNFNAAWDRADRALKKALQQGRNCLVIARPEA